MNAEQAAATQHPMFVTYSENVTITERVIASSPEEAIRRVRDGYGEEVEHEATRPVDFITSDDEPAPAGRWHLQDRAAPQ